MDANLISPIPMPESDALKEAPVKWALEVPGIGRVLMKVPLFSLYHFNVYSTTVRAVKFALSTANGVTKLQLDQLLAAKNDGVNEAGDLMREALVQFHDHYGVIPKDLADLLAAVSAPVVMEQALKVAHAWADTRGIGKYNINEWQLPEAVETAYQKPHLVRNALAIMYRYEMPVSNLVLILEQLEKINVEVKKKLVASHESLSDDRPSTPSNINWSRVSRALIASREARSQKSQSLPA